MRITLKQLTDLARNIDPLIEVSFSISGYSIYHKYGIDVADGLTAKECHCVLIGIKMGMKISQKNG